ncbi:alpha/beta hydrolase [Phenylobacterium deserti]|uniref:Alpha/beta hydrolase n=1 Tax=Phenylobacterium deserti TaxID=1914756 RepID=A0A328ATR3_9CAUL|nr:alpha/beta hydrolase [Phenylobacterium deserti]RAK56894.1 alpha/beta hydrolase [Phenylobacterium deserti]
MSDVDRRVLMGLAALAAAAPGLAGAETVPPDPTETITLWPSRPPGARGERKGARVTDRQATSGFQDRYWDQIFEPALVVFRAQKPNGAAMLICPGGGYARIVLDKEGFETARRLNAAGITCFVLRYRLPAEGWDNAADAPLQDAQRAIRLIRERAAQFGLDPARVGVMGFSAGGHVAGSLATRHGAQVYAPVDAADRQDARPSLAALIYPVVDLTGPMAHGGSRDNLLGKAPAPEAALLRSPQKQVSAATPPTFLVHAVDDATVPVENTLAMLTALKAAKIPTEAHIFEEGGHGFGLRLIQGKPAAAWPDLFLAWAGRHGLLA